MPFVAFLSTAFAFALFLFFLLVKRAVGRLFLQLVEPSVKGKSMYREFLEKRGEGVEHLGFRVDNVEEAEAKLTKLGVKPTVLGRREDGSGFT